MRGTVRLQHEAGAGRRGYTHLHAPVSVHVCDSGGAVNALGDVGEHARSQHGYLHRPTLEVGMGGYMVLGYLLLRLKAVGSAVMMYGVSTGVAGLEIVAQQRPQDSQQGDQSEGVAGDVQCLVGVGLVGPTDDLHPAVVVYVPYGRVGDYLTSPGNAAGIVKSNCMGQGIEGGDLLRVHQFHRPPPYRGPVCMPGIYVLVQAGGHYLQGAIH